MLETTGQLHKPGSAAHIRLLEAGYGMSLDRAKEIVELYKKEPLAIPYAEVEKARAMIEASTAKPKPVSKKPAWQRGAEYQLWTPEAAGVA